MLEPEVDVAVEEAAPESEPVVVPVESLEESPVPESVPVLALMPLLPKSTPRLPFELDDEFAAPVEFVESVEVQTAEEEVFVPVATVLVAAEADGTAKRVNATEMSMEIRSA